MYRQDIGIDVQIIVCINFVPTYCIISGIPRTIGKKGLNIHITIGQKKCFYFGFGKTIGNIRLGTHFSKPQKSTQPLSKSYSYNNTTIGSRRLGHWRHKPRHFHTEWIKKFLQIYICIYILYATVIKIIVQITSIRFII